MMGPRMGRTVYTTLDDEHIASVLAELRQSSSPGTLTLKA